MPDQKRKARIKGKSALMREAVEKNSPKKAEIPGGKIVTVVDSVGASRALEAKAPRSQVASTRAYGAS